MKLLTIILSALFLFSCKPKQVTIEGRLMADCNVPLANQSGTIHQKGMYAGKVADFTSDENGYFKAVFEPKGQGNICRIALEGGGTILEEIRFTEHTELGEVYANPVTLKYFLKLEVNNNSYSNLDTLVYSNGGFPYNGKPSWIKRAGPFHSGIIDTIDFASNLSSMPINHMMYNNHDFPLFRVSFYINLNSPDVTSHVNVPTPYCVEEYHNVVLVID